MPLNQTVFFKIVLKKMFVLVLFFDFFQHSGVSIHINVAEYADFSMNKVARPMWFYPLIRDRPKTTALLLPCFVAECEAGAEAQ